MFDRVEPLTVLIAIGAVAVGFLVLHVAPVIPATSGVLAAIAVVAGLAYAGVPEAGAMLGHFVMGSLIVLFCAGIIDSLAD